MKISNEYVNIKTNKRNITLKNMILNNYLYNFLKNILPNDIDFNTVYFQFFDRCFIKVEEKIEFNEKDMIPLDQFDFYFMNPIIDETNNKYSSTINYIFKTFDNRVYNAKNLETQSIIDGKQFIGKKITEIGFATFDSNCVGAILDVSNYDIYYDEGFSIFRKDTITSDSTFIQSGIIETPFHFKFLNRPYNSSEIRYLSRISGIGLAKNINKIEKTYDVLAEYPQNPTEDEMSIKLKILNDDGTTKNIYNPIRLGISTSLNSYIPFCVSEGEYKYIMILYNVYYRTPNGIYLYDTYMQAINLNKHGDLDLKIKFERG